MAVYIFLIDKDIKTNFERYYCKCIMISFQLVKDEREKYQF